MESHTCMTTSNLPVDDPPPAKFFKKGVWYLGEKSQADVDKTPGSWLYHRLGKGGMGKVYFAQNTETNQQAAIKLVLPGASADSLALFEKEIAATVTLGRHPQMVGVYDRGQEQKLGITWYAMEFAPGLTLKHHLAGSEASAHPDLRGLATPATFAMRIGVIEKIADAIAFAHTQGYKHLDLTVNNVVVDEFGEPRILDWGLSGSGSGRGTPNACAPEQMSCTGEVDERADSFMLGSLLYQLLSGQAVREVGEVVASHLPIGVTCADAVKELLFECLRESPGDRPLPKDIVKRIRDYRASQLQRELEEAEQRAKAALRKRTTSLVISGMGILLLGAAIALFHILNLRDFAEEEADKAIIARNEAQASERTAKLARDEEARARSEEALARKTAEDALAARDKAERDKAEQERVHREEREGLVKTRNESIDFLVLRLDPSLHTSIADRLLEVSRRGDDTSIVYQSQGERETTSEFLRAGSSQLQRLEELLLLDSSPVAGEVVPYLKDSIRQGYVREATELRVDLVHLSGWNDAHDLAQSLAEGLVWDSRKRAELLDWVTTRRNALSVAYLDATRRALEDVRSGIWRVGRASNAPTLEDYVYQLSAYKDHRVVEALGEALALLFTDSDFSSWTSANQDELALCARVLGRLDLGEPCVNALATAIRPGLTHPQAMEVGAALGMTRRSDAASLLYSLEEHFGWSSGTVYALRGQWSKLPDPTSALKDQSNARLIMALWHFNRGEHEKADQGFREFQDSNPANPSGVRAIIGQVQVALAREQYQDALKRADEALKAAPETLDILLVRSACYLALDRYQGAIADADRVLAATPDMAAAYANKALAWQALGDMEKALQAAELAIQRDPANARAYIVRARCQIKAGDTLKAIDDYSSALDVDPRNTLALMGRALALVQSGRAERALHDFDRLHELQPGNAQVILGRGEAKRALQRYDLAIADFNLALQINPELYPAREYRALAQAGLGEYESALSELLGIVRDRQRKELLATCAELSARWLAALKAGSDDIKLDDNQRNEIEAQIQAREMATFGLIRQAVEEGNAEPLSLTARDAFASITGHPNWTVFFHDLQRRWQEKQK